MFICFIHAWTIQWTLSEEKEDHLPKDMEMEVPSPNAAGKILIFLRCSASVCCLVVDSLHY